MFKKILILSRRFYGIAKIKRNCDIKHRFSDEILKKLFVSHIFPEEDSQWILKDSKNYQYIVHHASTQYKISVFTDTKLSIGKEIYGITLMPLKDWLVKENECSVLLNNSKFAKRISDYLLKKAADLNEIDISSNYISELMNHIRPTGYIVSNLNLNIPPILSGKLLTKDFQNFFIPFHTGFPPLLILQEMVDDLKNCNYVNTNKIYCELMKWEYDSPAFGRLLLNYETKCNSLELIKASMKSPNLSHDLESEVQNLLDSFNLKDEPFSNLITNFFINDTTSIKKRCRSRIDYRDKCVITIDPIDAKDLDDAIHIELLPDGNYEVGVHIADVSHFVKPSTPVDREALNRANSIYMIHKVIPMLPSVLSEDLCSLNSNEEKFTMSAIFILDSRGNVISERFVKSIIKPTIRLNYDEASLIIEGYTENLSAKNHPDFKLITKSVQTLHSIARILRENRIKNGALILDKVELKFTLDNDISNSKSDDTAFGFPSSFRVKNRGNSHFLVEELMLLANQAAARLMYNYMKSNPKRRQSIGALLRIHQFPDKFQCDGMAYAARDAGIQIHDTSSGELQKQIVTLKSTDPMKSLNMSYICYLNMQLAKYFCAEKSIANDDNFDIDNNTQSPFHHYGLNVPLYTHFTSPIRRYADIIVHRQIDAIINNKPDSGHPFSLRDKAAYNCNIMRPVSRRLQDRLNSLYMAAYLNKEGWRLAKAVVLKEFRDKFTVLLPYHGLMMKVHLNQFAPWAHCVTNTKAAGTRPASYRFKYHLDDRYYSIDRSNGFMQYAYRHVGRECETASVSSLDDNIDKLRLSNASNVSSITNDSNENHVTNVSSIDVKIFELIDCIIYCSQQHMRLSIEMPYPGLGSLIVNEDSRYL